MTPDTLSPRAIFSFWAPLAATWLLMAVEGPYLAAVVARLPEPTLGLAAFGVSIALALLVEAPVIMLLSASTALVEDAASYRRLRSFANIVNALSTALLLILLVPPVHRWTMEVMLELPPELGQLTYVALWCFLPWPAAIGYRRFLQGVLIRAGRTRLVALGTFIRLLAMSGTAAALATATGLQGASVAAAALSAGVVFEAVAVRWMGRHAIRALLSPNGDRTEEASPQTVQADPHDIAETGRAAVSMAPAGTATHASGDLRFGEIVRFYIPLALTSLIGIVVQPMLTFFMGRAPSPIESLAVFPVVHTLGFIWRAVSLSYMDAVIALLGKHHQGYAPIRRFGLGLGVVLTGSLGLIGFTPLCQVWLETVSGLSPELATIATKAIRVIAPIPFLGAILSLQRGVLMKIRKTGPISTATAVEMVTVAAVFVVTGWLLGWTGVTAAVTAFLCGRLGANIYLVPIVRRVLEKSARARVEAGAATRS